MIQHTNKLNKATQKQVDLYNYALARQLMFSLIDDLDDYAKLKDLHLIYSLTKECLYIQAECGKCDVDNPEFNAFDNDILAYNINYVLHAILNYNALLEECKNAMHRANSKRKIIGCVSYNDPEVRETFE